MQLTDTHCHIHAALNADGEQHTFERWQRLDDPNPVRMIERAADADVTKLLCVGCDVDDSRLAIEFVDSLDAQYEHRIYASIGIHPHEAARYTNDTSQLDEFRQLATRPKVVAVGECGLDFYYNHSPKEAQLSILRFQIELALEHNLP